MKHLLQSFIVIALCFCSYAAMAQMSYGGEPFSFKNTISQVVPTEQIEALDVEALLAEDETIEGKSHPLRIGVTKDVNLTINNSGRIDILPNGDRVWRIAFHMDQATFTSMNFSTFNIPDGAELFLYTPDREYVIGKFTNKNIMEDGTFYPQELPGEDVVVEYYEPVNAAFRGNLVINQISQGYRDFFHVKDVEGGIGDAEGNCHPNAICKDAQWHAQINSVACYTMTSGGSVGICSGAMINNTARNGKQYFLSANHCYTSGATYKFYFKYQATTCTGTNGSILKTATGATVKARAATDGDGEIYNSSDFMLLEITGTINPTYDVYFAGWNCTTSVPTSASNCGAIHHPGGDIKKFSTPTNIRNGALVYSNTANYWITNWGNQGTTEGGSSGSPLFNSNKLIVGQLQGGSSACDYTSGIDMYGKLSYSWTNNNNSNNARKLKPWLDPNNTGATTLDGQWMTGAPSALLEQEEVSQLNVFPNPSEGMFTIQGTFSGNDGFCNVYNLMGELVSSKKMTLNPEMTLNLSHLNSGMYLIEISDNDQIFRSKVLINK